MLETKSLIQAPVSRDMVLGEDQESELILCGDLKHACHFLRLAKGNTQQRSDSMHSFNKCQKPAGGSIKRIDSIAVARVSGISEISLFAARTQLPFFSFYHSFKTRPTLSQVCAGALRSRAVRR